MNKNKGKSRIVALTALVAAVALLVLFARVDITCGDEALSVNGFNTHYSLEWQEIQSVRIRSTLYRGERIFGVDTFTMAFGSFESYEYGQYRLDIFKNTPSYIVVTTVDGEVYIFNQRTTAETSAAYGRILEKTGGIRVAQNRAS